MSSQEYSEPFHHSSGLNKGVVVGGRGGSGGVWGWGVGWGLRFASTKI